MGDKQKKERWVPKLRFPGFTGDWEQRKLGDMLCSLQNNTLSRAELTYEEGTIKNVHYGDILVKYGEVLDVKNEQIPNIINTTIAEKYKASFLQNGDVIFADTAEDETVGKCSEIAGLTDEIALSGLHTIPYRPQLKFATGYLGYYLNSTIFHQQLIPLMQGIKVTSISKSAMQNIDIVYPKSFDEQEKIGAYFMRLDHLITLHQRRCDETKALKKYMVQKMLPKNGMNVPEIRFAGFTNVWEQCKLKDVTSSIKNGYTYKANGSRNHTYKITRIESISSGEINVDKLGSSDEINEAYRLEDGDILFSHINSLSYIANTALYTANLGEIYHGMNLLNIRVNHDIVNAHFLLHLLKKETSRSWFRIIAKPAVNQASISTTEVGMFQFMMPNMDEQQKIANYLDSLDHLITLHQRKLMHLKELKKGLLQQMFV